MRATAGATRTHHGLASPLHGLHGFFLAVQLALGELCCPAIDLGLNAHEDQEEGPARRSGSRLLSALLGDKFDQ